MGQGYKRETVNAPVVGSPVRMGYLIFSFPPLVTNHNSALSYATQHAIPRKAEGEEQRCLNTKVLISMLIKTFPLNVDRTHDYRTRNQPLSH